MEKEEHSTEKKEPQKMGLFADQKKLKENLREKLGKDVENLSKIINVGESKLDEYDKVREDEFEPKRIELEKYYKQKLERIEPAIKDKKKDIENIIKGYDEAITNIKKDVEECHNKTLPSARTEYSNSKNEFEKVEWEFNDLKDKTERYKDFIQNRFKKLDEIKVDIDQSKDEDAPKTFVRLNEFRRILDETDLKRADDLVLKYYEKWKDFDNKKKETQDKKEKKKTINEELNEKRKKVHPDKLLETRLDEILKRMGKEMLNES